MSLERILLNLFTQIQADLAKEDKEFTKDNVLLKLSQEHVKVKAHQKQCMEQLVEEEKIERSTLTSDSICKPGFDKTIVNKDISPPKKPSKKETKIEILNPKTLKTTSVENTSKLSTDKKSNSDNSDDEDIEISDLALAFSKLKTFDESFAFITKYPYFVHERYSDELLTYAFECELKKDCAYAEQCVFQSLIITYCIRLGKDGVSLFFKKLNTEGVEMFKKDAKETYLLLKERSLVIAEKSANESGKKSIFQLEPSSEDSRFVVNIPTDEDVDRLNLFNSLPAALKEALKTAEIDPINRALADLNEQEAEQALHICDEGEFLLFDVPTGAS
ncbi:hsp90 co-chaperone Cdc37 [Entomophthora muscae]|uniref:Hsp90 co-chaperone Cdc37 n=1 Tax=Entomophthora muscae TaxID=34485 RepID=A0ACC2RJI0_9FUNG|nr:hsp90 co-chaperone Cdc37 [Entomophthora muscae]